VNFGRAPELIAAAYDAATESLTVDHGRREHPEREIALHTHPRTPHTSRRSDVRVVPPAR
jgi:hypothetical protein